MSQFIARKLFSLFRYEHTNGIEACETKHLCSKEEITKDLRKKNFILLLLKTDYRVCPDRNSDSINCPVSKSSPLNGLWIIIIEDLAPIQAHPLNLLVLCNYQRFKCGDGVVQLSAKRLRSRTTLLQTSQGFCDTPACVWYVQYFRIFLIYEQF